MLFNTLANLRSLVREDVDRAESMIDQLIVYLRGALAASQTESVALRREFAQLRAYLDIMALRMGPRLSFRLELPAALEAITVPPMLLQPLVENAIKHGLEPKVGPGRIDVVASESAEGIEIRVNDSGLGLPQDEEDAASARPAGSNYGLQHVRDRLQAVYGPAAGLSLERRHPTGVSARVFIPHRIPH
jgi:sensor histidine kinase YesM